MINRHWKVGKSHSFSIERVGVHHGFTNVVAVKILITGGGKVANPNIGNHMGMLTFKLG